MIELGPMGMVPTQARQLVQKSSKNFDGARVCDSAKSK